MKKTLATKGSRGAERSVEKAQLPNVDMKSTSVKHKSVKLIG